MEMDDHVRAVAAGAAPSGYEPTGLARLTICENSTEVGVDWINGLVIHEGDADWHPWDPAIYEEQEER